MIFCKKLLTGETGGRNTIMIILREIGKEGCAKQ
jgi:hypothetical protein